MSSGVHDGPTGRHWSRMPGGHGAVAVVLGAMLPVLSGCDAVSSTLGPAGPGARRVASWWWLMFWIAVVVFAVVLMLLVLSLARRPGGGSGGRVESHWDGIDEEVGATHRRDRGWLLFVVLAGAVAPVVVMSGVMGVNLYSEHLVAVAAEAPTLTIDVTGHRWWWEVHYPEQDVTTANEVHIPAGQPVKLRLTSADVIHSFWVPRLAGKRDLIPGQTNVLGIAASQPGIYRGQCAEFCGVEHAKMALLVVADPPATFDAWLAQQRTIPMPTTELERAGQQVFLRSPCASCHTIRGTPAVGKLGPDLTHIGGRLTLGAGTISNTKANRAGWIVDSQAIKPGNLMPPMALTPGALQALLAYTAALE